METMSYSTVKMTDGSTHILSSHKITKSGMKANHVIKIGLATGNEYIVNTCNNRAYNIV